MLNVNRKTSTVVIETSEGQLKDSGRRAGIKISLPTHGYEQNPSH